MTEHDIDLYEIGKYFDEKYSQENFEKWIKEFVIKNYGASEAEEPSWNIKELAKHLSLK